MAIEHPDADATVVACCHLHRAMGCCDPTDCGPCCENCPTCPSLRRADDHQGIHDSRGVYQGGCTCGWEGTFSDLERHIEEEIAKWRRS